MDLTLPSPDKVPLSSTGHTTDHNLLVQAIEDLNQHVESIPKASHRPPMTKGLRAWYSAAEVTGLSTYNSVSKMYDLSGNGNHALRVGSNSTMVEYIDDPNINWANPMGTPVIGSFDADNNYLQLPSNLFSGTTQAHLFIYAMTSVADQALWKMNGTGTAPQHPNSSGDIVETALSSSAGQTSSQPWRDPRGRYCVYEVRHDGTSRTVKLDGYGGSVADTNYSPPSDPRIFYRGQGDVLFFTDFLMYDTVLDDSAAGQVRDWLVSRHSNDTSEKRLDKMEFGFLRPLFWPSNSYYYTTVPSAGSDRVFSAINNARTYFFPFWCPSTVTISSLVTYVTSGATGNVQAAIYTSQSQTSTQRPATRIHTTSEASTATTGFKEMAVNARLYANTLYWFAIQYSGTPGVTAMTAGTGGSGWPTTSTKGGLGSFVGPGMITGTYGTWPADNAGFSFIGDVPIVWVELA